MAGNRDKTYTFYRFTGNCKYENQIICTRKSSQMHFFFQTKTKKRVALYMTIVVAINDSSTLCTTEKYECVLFRGDSSIRKGEKGKLFLIVLCMYAFFECVCIWWIFIIVVYLISKAGIALWWRPPLFIPQFNTLHLPLWIHLLVFLCEHVNCGKFAIFISSWFWAELFAWHSSWIWLCRYYCRLTSMAYCYYSSHSCCYFWSTNSRVIPSHSTHSFLHTKKQAILCSICDKSHTREKLQCMS